MIKEWLLTILFSIVFGIVRCFADVLLIKGEYYPYIYWALVALVVIVVYYKIPLKRLWIHLLCFFVFSFLGSILWSWLFQDLEMIDLSTEGKFAGGLEMIMETKMFLRGEVTGGIVLFIKEKWRSRG